MTDKKELSTNIPQEPEWVQQEYSTNVLPLEDKPTKSPGKSPRKRTTRESTRKVIGRTPISSRAHHFTEMGNKERMFDLFGENIRYCKALGFIVWNGVKWVPDNLETVLSFASDTIKSIYEEASNILLEASETDDEVERKRLASIAEALTKWGKASETLKMVNSMVGLLKSDRRVQADIAQFDSHTYLFNFANGTVDVRTGKMHPHRREDYLTISVPFNYNPKAQAPVFMQFLRDIMLNREELVTFLQKAFGLCLTADVTEQIWFLLLGSGANGKTTLLEAIAYCMGDYSTAIDPSTISVAKNKDGGAASADVACLRGMRMVRVSETEQGTRLAGELIKRMSGGDTQKARFLYKDMFEFKYSHKMFVFTNHEPIVDDASDGFWRRVRKVPFDYKVPENKKDKQLTTKLESEVEGILAWMVEGAEKWKTEGLEVPEVVQQATQKYQEEQDILGTYIREYCLKGPKYKVKASMFKRAYNKWLEEEMSMKTITFPKLKREMEARMYPLKHLENGSNFIGLNLKSESNIQDMPLVDVTVMGEKHNGNGHSNGIIDLETLDTELSSIEGL